ncbi:ATP-dependent RNA helicase DED1 [Trypanosoma cruzi Dm28c]|uniref:RNA helicase n=1 Tax=Trypanosoma cruzi Dm28c TaxID=1416333 RepID=V5BCZ2_TRYCR|nr:ATP-dependent RNA helicase DED1 [Trypanosoma cruzi Dm28c]
MACAQTGSGKTAAFLVPVVHYILKHGVSPARERVSYPIAVIMAPTRELALQIYDEVRKLTFRTDIFYDVVYGGTPYPTRFENDILVACPGRLKDIFDRGIVSFSRVKFLVLDEADRMLEMGFEEQIEYLVASRYTDMPQTTERQTLMFSATFPQRILNLAKRYLRQHYYLLTVGRVGSTTKNITQKIVRVQESEKMDKLFEVIYQQKQTDLVLIFVETKRAAEELHYALKSEGIPSATIHGDRRQFDRERALRDFKDGITPILVATDVASRGLDVPNVAHVIQYDLPKEMDDYTHRIGRTGRAGNKGTATSFYNKNNRNLTVDLYNYLKEHEQDIPLWFEEEKENVEGERFLGMSRGRGGGGIGGRRGGGGGGGDNYRAAPTLSNSTWGESAPSRGRARGVGRPQNNSNVDDGGFERQRDTHTHTDA